MDAPARQLLLHGAIVFLISLLCGIPYGMAITRRWGDEAVRAWKLAHGALALGGTSAIAVAPALAALDVAEAHKWVIAIAFATSGYAFTVALVVEPFTGHRGLAWSHRQPGNNFVFVGNMLGAVASLVGALALVWAAAASL